MSNSVPKIDVVDIFEDVLCDVPIETLASLVYRKHLPFHGAFVWFPIILERIMERRGVELE